MAKPEPEEIRPGVASLLESHLRPGMTAALVGPDGGAMAALVAERVGPSGRFVAVDPEVGSLEDALPEHVDLILVGTTADAHLALQRAPCLLERSRPVLLANLHPHGLRVVGTDPVSLLDRYRAMGLRATGAEAELPSDPGELVQAVDAADPPQTTLRLERVDPRLRANERLLPAGRRLGRSVARRFPPPTPATLAYDASHRALISFLLDSNEWDARFAAGASLPPGLGRGFDERVVEYPWLFSRRLTGRVLDAGSVLNHRHLVERLLPAIDDLTIVTLAPEPRAFNSMGVSYLYGDLRRLPFRDGWFDEVTSLSTLEHVGMDNAVYGDDAPRAEDPQAEAIHALRELLRVVRPGGRVHLSVPFGRREDHGWFRQLDREQVDVLLDAAGSCRRDERLFVYTGRGWRRGSPRRAARARYNLAPAKAADGAVAARAVLCATIHR